MGRLHDLAACGQAIWFDFIQRSLISSGELQRLIDEGVRGVTSNPTIFEKAITASSDYDLSLKHLARQGMTIEQIYEGLVLHDISLTADLFLPVYVDTKGLDGYVSIEVDPRLAYDTDRTVSEARRLWKQLNKSNVMIKVPATDPGIPAMETLISEGINVNATLLFSVSQYEKAAEAYLQGLEKRILAGGDVRSVASVASFFVSRIDTAVDLQLAGSDSEDLLGKAAIASAKVAYEHFSRIFAGPRWERIAAHGARVQRLLWASTGTKNPRYPDTLYVDRLIGPHTVNTLPPATLGAFMDHGHVSPSLECGLAEAKDQLHRLSLLGIDLEALTRKLEDDGVRSFASSFASLMESIEKKRTEVMPS
ncbi:MAG TPA: transaldolase [Deltaproteobacteria bacterium]|nr:transaldolase [Deltaproteobacteria bacterium]HQI81167.1 transaldolase [Deltaproteobacteria bacterium]